MSTTTSFNFLGWLAILFIGLKLTGYISWSWWWVLSPVWVPAAIIGAILLAVFTVKVISEV